MQEFKELNMDSKNEQVRTFILFLTDGHIAVPGHHAAGEQLAHHGVHLKKSHLINPLLSLAVLWI